MKTYRFLFAWFILLLFVSNAPAQSPDYYFPDGSLDSIDSSVPMPRDIIGFPIGKWHISHDQIIRYSKALAKHSPRVDYIPYAESHEGRPLFVLRITSPGNLNSIEEIRKNHLASAKGNPLPHPDLPDPLVLYQGNSIHGDESSGANASMLYAWHLASSNKKSIKSALEQSVILVDPCFNPDGLHRFSTWVNSNTGTEVKNSDPEDREFNEPWPSGRTNHYWFDLNRDWLLVQHPESRGRIQLFNRWLPHVLTDHHEMGSDATYFFQPGIQSRTNPITLEQNQELTAKIAEYHSKQLDELGSLYYTRESFDDYYYGKGSTYPDVRGSIGILFEQASSRGHRQETENGVLTFPFTIKNQLTTLRSTLDAGISLSEELKDYQKSFYETERRESEGHDIRAYLVRQCKDPVRWNSFLKLLANHDIYPRTLSKDVQAENISFRAQRDVILPMNEEHFFLKRTLFETQHEFPDFLFYDVSTWTLPLAYHLEYAPYTGGQLNRLTGEPVDTESQSSHSPFVRSEYGYIIPWYHFNAASAAAALLENGFRVSTATKPFTAKTVEGSVSFGRGDLFVPVQDNQAHRLHEMIRNLQIDDQIPVYAVTSGLTPQGIDLGSPSMEMLEYPRTLLLAGQGIRGYDAGEIWHLFNTRLHLPITKVSPDRWHRVDLGQYQRIIIPHTYHLKRSKEMDERLNRWIRQGGVLILERGANRWAEDHKLIDLSKEQSADDTAQTGFKEYSGLDRDRGKKRIGGSIFHAVLDTTHPIAYGYDRDNIALFKRGTLTLGISENAYAQPILFTEEPLASGYAPQQSIEDMARTAAVRIFRKGRGRIICFANNTHFRAYFRGTERLFVNAVFFGHIIDRDSAEKTSED